VPPHLRLVRRPGSQGDGWEVVCAGRRTRGRGSPPRGPGALARGRGLARGREGLARGRLRRRDMAEVARKARWAHEPATPGRRKAYVHDHVLKPCDAAMPLTLRHPAVTSSPSRRGSGPAQRGWRPAAAAHRRGFGLVLLIMPIFSAQSTAPVSLDGCPAAQRRTRSAASEKILLLSPSRTEWRISPERHWAWTGDCLCDRVPDPGLLGQLHSWPRRAAIIRWRPGRDRA
jgi:hypothetical protein